MSENETSSPDEWLRLYLNTPSAAESAKFFDLLIENCACPLIEKILSAKFGGRENKARFSLQDYEDLRGECCVKIISALRVRKMAAETLPPIRDFPSYCSTIIYNVWNGFLREHSPNRENLKNKILYSLEKDSRFATLTDIENKIFYYLMEQKPTLSGLPTENLTQIVRQECEFFAQVQLPDLLACIFEKANGGLKISLLVKIVADLWQVRDLPHVSLDDFHERAVQKVNRNEDLEMRCKLEYIWREIRVLPILQRTALLYNLRDEQGGEMLFAFFNMKIATLNELAAAMNLDKTQFANLLPQLPFDDKRIAAVMNLTVIQIRNLRKVARDNLRRRLDGKTKRKRTANRTEIFNFGDEDQNGTEIKSKFLN